MSDIDINNNLTQIPEEGKGAMKEKMKGIILIIIFFVALIIFAILYPYVFLFMNLQEEQVKTFMSYFNTVFPVLSAFGGALIGYFLGQKKSE
jgi:hypothetical protein